MKRIKTDLHTSEWAQFVRDIAVDVCTHAVEFEDSKSPASAEKALEWISNLESTLKALRENIERNTQQVA
jgi:hypothetical protein